MNFSHPFSRYGLALVMLKEGLNNKNDIVPSVLAKYLENGLNHFRMKSDNNPETDEFLDFNYISMQTIINNNIKGNPSKGIYLCPNIITNDLKAHNSWSPILELIKKLGTNPDLLNQIEPMKMGIVPIAGELNNGSKSKSNAKSIILEVACCAITNTTLTKPYLAYREKGGKYTPTAIIPDLELPEMITFIQLYDWMLNTGLKGLLKKKVYRKDGVKPKYSRPPIYNGNFPYAPYNSAFGVVGLLGAIGRWAKEANKIEDGQKVLESLKDKPIYIIQYGNAQSVTINHYIIDLAKENKLSEIVMAIQKSQLIHPFDEKDPKDAKGIESKKDIFNLFSSRFLQFFNLPTFKDFLSVRAEYSHILIELFNIFFIKQMKITSEIVDSAQSLGGWLNYIAYKVAKQEADSQKKLDKLNDFKAKILIELESSVFGARKPAEMLNVIVRAGRLSGMSAPANSDIFQKAVLTESIELNDAKSMLMAFARTRNRQEQNENPLSLTSELIIDEESDLEIDVTE